MYNKNRTKIILAVFCLITSVISFNTYGKLSKEELEILTDNYKDSCMLKIVNGLLSNIQEKIIIDYKQKNANADPSDTYIRQQLDLAIVSYCADGISVMLKKMFPSQCTEETSVQQSPPPVTYSIGGETYTQLKKFGQGGQSEVFLVENSAHKKFIIKVAKNKTTFRDEKKIVDIIGKHENVVDWVSCNQEYTICVLDFAEHGSLKDFFGKIKEKEIPDYNETQAKKLAKEILIGATYVMSRGVSHNDLEDRNLLVSQDSKGNLGAKVCDFGTSSPLPATDHMDKATNFFQALSPLIQTISHNQFTGVASLKPNSCVKCSPEAKEFLAKVKKMGDSFMEAKQIISGYIIGNRKNADLILNNAIDGTSFNALLSDKYLQ
ncbi:MAG: protein kinase [Oligoflexia bacterium]|nr:protein kinase [Oligoflexia bacterium]